jgi:hypothetical protein
MIQRIVFAGVLALATVPAYANDTVLATSKSHKLQVFADGGATWCAPTLRLRMVLEADSPDAGNPGAQLELMNRLKTPITSDCKAASAAELTVIEQGRSTGIYKAAAAAGWVFAAAPAASVPQPVVTQAPTPSAPQGPASPPPVVQAPQPAMPAAPQAAELDYFEALARVLRDNPALAQDDSTIRLWASHRYEREYSQLQHQEFKLQPVLQRARADFADYLARPRGNVVTIATRAYFRTYDFNARRFPIDDLGTQVSYQKPCCVSVKVPTNFVVKLQDLDAVTGLPMDPAEAQALAERRTRYGSINRTIYLALTVRLEAGGFKGDGWGSSTILGTVEGVTFYPDDRLLEPILTIGAEEFARWRANRAAELAEAARLAEQREAEQHRQRWLAQREQNIRALSGAPSSVRLANYISDGDLSLYTRLSDLRSARAAALMSGKPVPVAMLVQSDGAGRSKVASKWPGKLELTVADPLPELAASQWYLVRGLLSVPEAEGLPPAQLTAQAIHICAQPKCADVADPAVIIDRKLAGGR